MTDDDAYQFVNGTEYTCGTSDAQDGRSTGEAVGTGKANTAKLLAVMGSTAEAATACDGYTLVNGDTTYDDWFIPSIKELILMRWRLYGNGVGDFAFCVPSVSGNTEYIDVDDCYWSSSEYGKDAKSGQALNFYNCNMLPAWRVFRLRIRPVRAFSSDSWD